MSDDTATKPYEALVKKPISDVNTAFTDWLTKNTGYEVDARSVALASNLRNIYHNSPEYKANSAEREKAKAQAEIEALRKAAAAAEKRQQIAKEKLAKAERILGDEEPVEAEVEVEEPEVEEPETEEVVETIKAKRAAAGKPVGKPAAAPAATKPAPRRRPAAKA